MGIRKIAESVADLAVGLKYDDLSNQAKEHAKVLTLDVLASMIGTRDIFTSKVARETANELGGRKEASIINGEKVSVSNAAFANAIQCYGFDFVDDHNESNAHPSPATFPVTLALSEFLHKDGKTFLTALALGNEIVCRMGTSYLGDMYYQGFHPTSTCGTIGAAVSAGYLLEFNKQKQIYVQGIAGSMVAGLMAWNSEGSYTKRLQAGHPAMCGIIAAKLANKGFNGPSDIFESKDGLFHAYSFKDHYDGKYMTDDLGQKWIFADSSIKVYPCCRYAAGHLDACLKLVNDFHPDPQRITAIRIRSSHYTMHLLAEARKWHPENVVDLQFSMPYQAAIAFLNGKVTVDEFDTKYINDPVVKKLISMTKVVEDTEFELRYPEHYSSAVKITMDSGESHEIVIDDPKGDWRNPVTFDDVKNKFRFLVNRVYKNPQRAEDIINYVDNIENEKDVAELVDLINLFG